jgi:hypothetical protein
VGRRGIDHVPAGAGEFFQSGLEMGVAMVKGFFAVSDDAVGRVTGPEDEAIAVFGSAFKQWSFDIQIRGQ